MGDRAQVAINDGKHTSVYLYTHWNGSELADTVKRALAKRQRWTDAEYLTRIIFCEMVKGAEAGKTGFGISTSEHFDNEHPLIVLNCAKQKVYINGETATFKQYAARKESES